MQVLVTFHQQPLKCPVLSPLRAALPFRQQARSCHSHNDHVWVSRRINSSMGPKSLYLSTSQPLTFCSSHNVSSCFQVVSKWPTFEILQFHLSERPSQNLLVHHFLKGLIFLHTISYIRYTKSHLSIHLLSTSSSAPYEKLLHFQIAQNSKKKLINIYLIN